MKKMIFVITFLLVCVFSQAQESHIIYTLFEPDTCSVLQSPSDTIFWDLNQDGTHDIYFYLKSWSYGDLTYMSPVTQWEWSNSIRIDQNSWEPLTDASMIDETLYWESGYSFISGYDMPEWWYFAFRHQAEDGLHYGWACIKPAGYLTFCISSMGYCTLPDHPIRWGQTELLGVEEFDASNTFATIYPNPTTGMVTITGEKLKQAEVFNMLGQQMLSTKGEGNELQIDMTALPAGVYFVTVTDEEGRRCVQKVVKE